ncbi:MAG: tetratricopeptide repeat protein [Hahellaceae bacterium]|nr:tetratricopeptide repeat protein [Hahellaceae bacterium]MCP5211839.1 tetratricopeptide repeat protein [Hahellaceae bacterium]
MDYERTEEEQIAALKRWWSENGNSLIIGIALALAAIFGWQAWQQQVLNTKYEASSLYQQILDAASVQSIEAKEKNLATVRLLGEKLKSDYSSSEYAKFAALFLAKAAIDAKDLTLAEGELRWVLSQNPDAPTRAIVNARLARLLLAQDKVDEAAAIVSKPVDKPFLPMFLEIRGDIALAKGDRVAARSAYEEAKSLLKSDDRERILLEMKLSDVADIEGV